jgi:aspartate kinase
MRCESWRHFIRDTSNFSISSSGYLSTEALSKDILAQGELLSTKLFSVFLEGKIDHQLLPALDFMSIDSHDEPRLAVSKVKLGQLLQQLPNKSLFITQGISAATQRVK